MTAIFRAYAKSLMPDAIVSVSNGQRGLFDNFKRIDTDPAIADRVWTGLKRHLGARQRQRLFQTHLSGDDEVETLNLQHILMVIPGRRGFASAVDLSVGIRIDQLSQKVRREAHRVKGFIRFHPIPRQSGVAPPAAAAPLLALSYGKKFQG